MDQSSIIIVKVCCKYASVQKIVKIIIMTLDLEANRMMLTCPWDCVGLRTARSETRRNPGDLRWRPSATRFYHRNPTKSCPSHLIDA